MTEYGKFHKQPTTVKHTYSEVRERRKKQLEEVRKRRAQAVIEASKKHP